jgi:hypothetical protein
MNLSEFKNELRLVYHSDKWGCAMDALFECIGRMYIKGVCIDTKHEYSPGFAPTDDESYFHDLFKNCTNLELHAISEFLYRYCEYLRYKGIDY